MNPFEIQMNELTKLLEEILDSHTDAELEERYEMLLTGFAQALNSPEAQLMLQDIIKEIDIKGYEPDQIIDDLSQAQAAIAVTIANVKAKYPDSIIK